MDAKPLPRHGGTRGGGLLGSARKLALAWMVIQVTATVIFVVVPRRLSVFDLIVIANAVGSIGVSIRVLRKWQEENPRPQNPKEPPWMLYPLILALLFLMIAGAVFFVDRVYGGNFGENYVEGFNFSVQTVTTVGYGNWPLVRMQPNKFAELRQFSIWLMLSGASIFTILLGMITTWLQRFN